MEERNMTKAMDRNHGMQSETTKSELMSDSNLPKINNRALGVLSVGASCSGALAVGALAVGGRPALWPISLRVRLWKRINSYHQN
jgi:hypothetical protein